VRRTPPALIGRGWVSLWERYAGNMPQKIGGLLADDRPFRNGKLAFYPHSAHHLRLPKAGTFNDAYASNIFWRSLWTTRTKAMGEAFERALNCSMLRPQKSSRKPLRTVRGCSQR
jgi:hypothetical protein